MNRSLQLARAWSDLVQSIRLWPLWTYIGWQEIRLRYRRSVLGPFWITLSMGITIVAVGILYSEIFRTDIRVYLPFFAVGFMFWAYINSLIVDGCMIFINDGSYLKKVPVPLITYVFRTAWRALLIFVHNFVIFFGVAWYCGLWSGWGYFEALLGLIIVTINGLWISLILTVICCRYRDVPQIVQSVMSVAFFLTPILWDKQSVRHTTSFIDYNPFYHLIEVVRAPLLGAQTPVLSFAICTVIAILGCVFSFLFFSRYRRRVAYWV